MLCHSLEVMSHHKFPHSVCVEKNSSWSRSRKVRVTCLPEVPGTPRCRVNSERSVVLLKCKQVDRAYHEMKIVLAAAIVFVLGVTGDQLSANVLVRFIGQALVGIAKKQHLEAVISLPNITATVDPMTTVEFTNLSFIREDVRITGEYETISNDVSQAFPREGKLNVTLHDFFGNTKLEVPTEHHLSNSSTNLDGLVDFILLIVRDTLRETGRDQIDIPDVDQKFSADILFFPVDGTFKAEGGWFKNLSTVHRTSDTIATTSDTVISVQCALGLQTMVFGYRHYDATLGSMTASGEITGTVASNSITAKISLMYVNETCQARLDSLKVMALSGIDITLTGWDGFGWLLSFIANLTSGSYKDKIVSTVERTLSAIIEKKLSRFHCSHYFQQLEKLPLRASLPTENVPF